MPALGGNNLTLVDKVKSLAPDGTMLPVAEMLAEDNPILQHAVVREGNLPTGHRMAVRTSLPTIHTRRLNQGVASSKSTKAQMDEGCAIYNAWSEVDKLVAEIGGNVAETRLDEGRTFLEAMMQRVIGDLLYADVVSDETTFNGIMSRYNSLSGTISRNVIAATAGATGGDQASILLVQWHEQGACLIYPKGTMAGLDRHDYGLQPTTLGTEFGQTTHLSAYQEEFLWRVGLAIKDWRSIVRICNIDTGNLTADITSTAVADLVQLMIKAIHRIPFRSRGGLHFYMPRELGEYFHGQTLGRVWQAGPVSQGNVGGEIVGQFMGIPVHILDQMTVTEDLVAA